MARKRSVSGRSRKSTISSNIYLQASKINRKMRSLKRGGNLGKYASKTFLIFAEDNEYLSVKNRRGKKTPRLVIKNLAKASLGQLILINKKFKHYVKSKTFTNVGINDARANTREKVTKTLEGSLGRKLTDKDADLFYEIIKYKSDEIIQKIGVSEFYNLVMEARDASMDVEGWVELLGGYIEVNNEYIREACEYLYNKFVR